ncbi:L,D-transpeptidase family protein [Pistricoccus aurantiacus]|uniref:L,D-transpeptidase n=1 Tax=Pistricoccus aurantiacus TaxID=1883414 RepID=A0A5B8SRK7_9GAMM|nr:L,D-transpeptidase [Pistricoccus aurantiacus]QEA39809.1 L,D-transpeptidase [Pistricoccus aurantiacus]
MGRLLSFFLPLLTVFLLSQPAQALESPVGADELWILVDEPSSSLSVYRGSQEITHFPRISVGRGGVKRLRREGDRSTPLGTFHINRIKLDSDFHIFLGLDFPTPEIAREAWSAGRMSFIEYADFMAYLQQNGEPPQDTVLGGYIGIHGLGDGDPDFHRRYDWTQGCVAVTNEQIEQLLSLIEIGTTVVIR